MQSEMTQTSCPLCRRRLPASEAGQAPGTRLCEQCQSLVQTAFPGALSRSGTSAANPETVKVIPQVQPCVTELGDRQLDPPLPSEDVTVTADPAEQDMPSLGPELREDEESSESVSSVESSWTDEPAGWAFQQANESAMFEQPMNDVQANPAANEYAVEHEASCADASQHSHATSAGLPEEQSLEPKSASYEPVADPPKSALAEWNYVGDDWPVLVGPPSRRTFRTIRAWLVVIAVLGFAALLYALVRPLASQEQHPRSTADSSSTERASAAAEPRASLPGSVAPDVHNQTPPDSRAGADSKLSQTRDEVASSEKTNAQGRFSLQAAAFPTQSGADEFAERLKRIGVPSYVVPADLARRGRWFRVRIGRFNTAEDGQTFAAEAQRRAAAIGISLQLIVCQYERP